MNRLFVILTAVPFAALAAAPEFVDSVTAEQPAGTVRVSYSLDRPAVVTLDVQTNAGENAWVSIGEDAVVVGSDGDVNRIVDAGARQIRWRPQKTPLRDRTLAADSVRFVVSAWATNAPPEWMVVDAVNDGDARFYATAAGVPGGIGSEDYKTSKFLLRKVQAAGVTWRMGENTVIEKQAGADASTATVAHEVTLTEDFYLAVYETTQKQWTNVGRALVSPGSSGFPDKDPFTNRVDSAVRPVCYICIDQIRGTGNSAGRAVGHVVDKNSFFDRLRKRVGSELMFDLPYEAQWEFAARAGSRWALPEGGPTALSTTDLATENLNRHAWTKFCSYVEETEDFESHPVGTKEPNAWGFYDMLGNVSEFCLDFYVADLGKEPAIDPVGGPANGQRVLRGGNYEGGVSCRNAYRVNGSGAAHYHTNGFRVWAPACVSLPK